MADILSDEIVARGHHQMAAAHITHVMQQLRHPHGDGGLACARVAGERHVQGGPLGR